MKQTEQKRENIFLNLGLTILAPTIILTKFTEQLGVELALIIALSFPLGYGIYDFFQSKKVNFLAVLGFINVILTGTLTLLKTRNLVDVNADWYAIKEAAFPLLIGISILVSLKTKTPLVKKLLYNDAIIKVDKIEMILKERGNKDEFEKLLLKTSLLLAVSFLVSSILNYVLAKVILLSPPGTAEFNAELGQMNLYSFPVIAVPSTLVSGFALWQLIKGLKKLTDLEMEEMLNTQK